MEKGKTTINDAVFVEIAKEAMKKVASVYRQEKKGTLNGITRAFTEKFDPHITVKKVEAEDTENAYGTIALDLRITVIYGVVIPEVAKQLKEKIISEIQTLTGYSVERVDIYVEKIILPEQVEEANDNEEETESE